MERHGSALRVGMFLVALVALALALVWFLRGGQINNGTQFVTFFSESVQGLQRGSTVEYRGVDVGRVTQIGVVSAIHGHGAQDVVNPLYQQVYVRYLVNTEWIGKFSSIGEAVRMGLRARLNSSFITGIAFIDLDFVDPHKYPVPKLPWTPEGVFVPSVPSTFQQVQNAGQKLLAKLDKVDVATLIDQLGELSKNLNAELTSGGVHQTLSAATDLFNTANGAVAKSNLPQLTADLKRMTDQFSALATNPDLKKLLTNGALATDRLGHLTAQMTNLVGSLDKTVRQMSTTANQLQAGLAPMMRNMQEASRNLREFTATIRQYPAQILSAPPPPTTGPLR